MQHRSLKLGIILAAGLLGTVSFAQRMGGGGGRPGGAPPGGGGGQSRPSPEELDRAANAKKWQDLIERARANSPPAPMPKINFPSKNEMFLRGLCCCVDPPRVELGRYLDTMWNGAGQPAARRAALDTFWQQAEKPKWARAAIEEFYRQRTNGQPLRATPEELAAAKEQSATTTITTPTTTTTSTTTTTAAGAPAADVPPEPTVVPESKPATKRAAGADR